MSIGSYAIGEYPIAYSTNYANVDFTANITATSSLTASLGVGYIFDTSISVLSTTDINLAVLRYFNTSISSTTTLDSNLSNLRNFDTSINLTCTISEALLDVSVYFDTNINVLSSIDTINLLVNREFNTNILLTATIDVNLYASKLISCEINSLSDTIITLNVAKEFVTTIDVNSTIDAFLNKLYIFDCSISLTSTENFVLYVDRDFNTSVETNSYFSSTLIRIAEMSSDVSVMSDVYVSQFDNFTEFTTDISVVLDLYATFLHIQEFESNISLISYTNIDMSVLTEIECYTNAFDPGNNAELLAEINVIVDFNSNISSVSGLNTNLYFDMYFNSDVMVISNIGITDLLNKDFSTNVLISSDLSAGSMDVQREINFNSISYGTLETNIYGHIKIELHSDVTVSSVSTYQMLNTRIITLDNQITSNLSANTILLYQAFNSSIDSSIILDSEIINKDLFVSINVNSYFDADFVSIKSFNVGIDINSITSSNIKVFRNIEMWSIQQYVSDLLYGNLFLERSYGSDISLVTTCVNSITLISNFTYDDNILSSNSINMEKYVNLYFESNVSDITDCVIDDLVRISNFNVDVDVVLDSSIDLQIILLKPLSCDIVDINSTMDSNFLKNVDLLNWRPEGKVWHLTEYHRIWNIK